MAKTEETREENQALAARWKGKQKKPFHQKNQGERPTTEMKEDRIPNMKESRTTRMTKDLIVGLKEDQTEADKTENPILEGSNALVVKDMVT